MLPYFIFTEEVQGFCSLMGYYVADGATQAKYVCMYLLSYSITPQIAPYNLSPEDCPFIPNELVLNYLALILSGHSYEDAVKEVGVVWG